MRKYILAVAKAMRAYPAILAGALNIAVALAARFGLSVSADQLATVMSLVTAGLSVLVHKATVPASPAITPAKAEPPKAPAVR
jgi:hypothetical protein